ISLDRNIGACSFGGEFSYVRNAALIGSGLANGDGPRGDVFNVALNSVLTSGSTPFFDSSTTLMEVGWQHLVRVNKHAGLFHGLGYGNCVGGHKSQGCASKDAIQVAVNFTPKWTAVFPQWNFYLPITTLYTVYGNGATLAAQSFGVNQGAFTGSIGIEAEYKSQYTATLTYADGYANYNEVNGVATGGNGGWFLNDRGR